MQSKTFSKKIVTGQISKPEVVESLPEYHDVAALWFGVAQIHKKWLSELRLAVYQKSYTQILIWVQLIPYGSASIEDNDTITYRTVKNDVQLIKSVSVSHKKEMTYLLPEQNPVSLVPPLSASESIAPISTMIVKEKKICTVAFYSILSYPCHKQNFWCA